MCYFSLTLISYCSKIKAVIHNIDCRSSDAYRSEDLQNLEGRRLHKDMMNFMEICQCNMGWKLKKSNTFKAIQTYEDGDEETNKNEESDGDADSNSNEETASDDENDCL